jgi:hypothetical protein
MYEQLNMRIELCLVSTFQGIAMAISVIWSMVQKAGSLFLSRLDNVEVKFNNKCLLIYVP